MVFTVPKDIGDTEKLQVCADDGIGLSARMLSAVTKNRGVRWLKACLHLRSANHMAKIRYQTVCWRRRRPDDACNRELRESRFRRR